MDRTARFFVFALFLGILVCPHLSAGTRGISIHTSASGGWGDFHALIVGIDDYVEWTPLRTAVKDATVLQKVLVERYGFGEDRVVLLTDAEASRGRIILALRSLAAGLTKTDNLLIYYAGHGQIDDLTGDGYWIPAEGKLKDPSTWVSHSIVKNLLSSDKVRAKNVVLVADACYSGTLLREGPSMLSIHRADYNDELRAAAARPSRQVITSGGMEPVADGGKDGHSLFAYYFLKALKENDRQVVDLENLFHTRVWKPVTEIGGQRPNVGRLKTPMDEDGQFVLTLLAAATEKAATSEVEKQRIAEEQQWQARIEEERARIEIERRRLEEEKQLMAQRWELEREKRELELKKRELEQEKQQMAHETVKNRPPEKKAPMEVAALSAPAPSMDAPLKIGLFPWRFRIDISIARTYVNEKNSFSMIYEAVSQEERFIVTHSHYDFEPPSEHIDDRIAPLSLSPEEIDGLWIKKNFFSSVEPNTELAVSAAKKRGLDVALFINCHGSYNPTLMITLIDVATEETIAMEETVFYITYGNFLQQKLRKQLSLLLEKRR